MCSSLLQRYNMLAFFASFSLLAEPQLADNKEREQVDGPDIPVLDRRCIWLFCLDVALAAAALADFDFVACPVAIVLTCGVLVRLSRIWGGSVDICICPSDDRQVPALTDNWGTQPGAGGSACGVWMGGWGGWLEKEEKGVWVGDPCLGRAKAGGG